KSKRAFATFLAGEEDSDENDPYFVAVRVLTYQLLHAKETASRDRSIPFVVMATKNVSESKRNRLRKDGAIVVVGDWLYADWVQAATSAWRDIMVKLRLWELTQFDRIAMLDGDTVLTEPIDGIFDDPAVTMQTTLDLADAIKDDEQPLPEKYAFAGIPEMSHEHGYPPTDEHHDFMNINYFNGGFFVFQPSLEAFNYYTSLLQIPGRFDPSMMEQNLLNYAHRRDGNMPWQQLGNTWNIHYPTVADLDGGVKSLHEKWWTPEHADLKPYLESWRWQMKGYFEARDKL
ncbi:glycosyltransferase family 8 protein, partial [Trematosphaeria pertusa]